MSPTSIEERDYMTHGPYSTVGNLMYAVVYRKSDLSQAVSMISRYMHEPNRGSLGGSEVILWYIKGTIYVGLIFKKDFIGKQECIGYVDLDNVGDLNKCQSITGYVFILFQELVRWLSILQSNVTLSLMEAEYMAMIEPMKEAIWLQGLLDDFGIAQEDQLW